MTTLLLAEHDNKSLKDATTKALSAAKAIGGDAVSYTHLTLPTIYSV